MKRSKIAAGNWKMNKTLSEGIEYIKNINSLQLDDDVNVILFVPFTHLNSLNFQKNDKIKIGAQNMHQSDKGAYTGEVSGQMLTSMGIKHVIIGHSERREYFNEKSTVLLEKVVQALSLGITPVFCCGESLEIRMSGNPEQFIIQQLNETIFKLTADEISKIIIAYEPIWAIGTGETATAEQAQSMHSKIRSDIGLNYGAKVANTIPILYGGSVKPKNAVELFSQADIDGGLVGGASLDPGSFQKIVNSFNA